MNAAKGEGSVFAVEVVETVSTLYRVRAIDEDQAGRIATAHNIAAGAHGGSVVARARRIGAAPERGR